MKVKIANITHTHTKTHTHSLKGSDREKV